MKSYDSQTGTMKMGFISNEYETSPILHFLLRNNFYWVYHKNTVEEEKVEESPVSKLWHIIKFYKNNSSTDEGFKLEEGDIIKLGRVRFKIKEIHQGQYQPKPVQHHDDPLLTERGQLVTKAKTSVVVPIGNRHQ